MLDGWMDGWLAGSVRHVCDCLGICFLEGSADCVARWLGNAMHRRGVGIRGSYTGLGIVVSIHSLGR